MTAHLEIDPQTIEVDGEVEVEFVAETVDGDGGCDGDWCRSTTATGVYLLLGTDPAGGRWTSLATGSAQTRWEPVSEAEWERWLAPTP